MSKEEIEFTALVREYKSTIYTVCMMFSEDPNEVDDMVQEALITLWKGFMTLTSKEYLKSWVWKVTMNSCISYDRKKKHKKEECPLTPAHENLMNTDDVRGTQIKMLYDRIHLLQPFDRAIVMLWLDGMPYEEIGQIMGISTKNVSVRLFRIKEELKNKK